MKELASTPEKVTDTTALSEAQWRERLSADAYYILRQAGTERPGGAVYQQFKQQGEGDYHCAGCGALLFASAQKFDSRCGWPSFWDPAALDTVETREDRSLGMVRTEVVCANCKGHLGHLFTGEGFDTPTDQRYCINGTVLVFVPRESEE
jgi:peptide-methionine (R)-S-oxide reductase